MKDSFRLAHLALWLCAMIWGIGFLPQKLAMMHMGPLLFNALRSALPAMVLGVLLVFRRVSMKKGSGWLTRSEWRVGMSLGAWLWLALGAQQIGLVDAMVYRASFITGLYIICVPFVAFLLFATPIVSWQLSMAGLGCLGLFLLTTSAHTFDIGRGDLWILFSSLLWAVHVGVMGHHQGQGRILPLAFIQMATCMVLSAISSWLLQEPWHADAVVEVRWYLLYSGLLSGCGAYTLQIYGQRWVSPPVAAIILSLEALFGAAVGWFVLNEPFSLRNLMGAGLIMLAITLVQVTAYVQMRVAKRTKPSKEMVS